MSNDVTSRWRSIKEAPSTSFQEKKDDDKSSKSDALAAKIIEKVKADLEPKLKAEILGSPTYLRPTQIANKALGAIVDVEAISVITTALPVPATATCVDPATGATITAPPATAPASIVPAVERREGSGFFSDGRYIVTAANLVTLDNPSVVPILACPGTGPAVTVDVVIGQRIPAPLGPLFIPGTTSTTAPTGTVPVIRAGHIFVRVYCISDDAEKTKGKNKCSSGGCGSGKCSKACCSVLYEALLVGLDPQANIAVLRIDEKLQFNRGKPKLIKTPFLRWGQSRKYTKGSSVYNLSNADLTGNKFSAGVVRDNKDPDVASTFYEQFETDIVFHDGMVGSPLLDSNGNVVAVVTGETENIDNSDILEAPTPAATGVPAFAGSPVTGIIPGTTTTGVLASNSLKTLGNTGTATTGTGALTSTDFLYQGATFQPNSNQVTSFNNQGTTPPFALLPTQNPQGSIIPLQNVAPKGQPVNITGTAFGVPQSIITRIVDSIIAADQGKCNKHIDLVRDPLGAFFVYVKGWLDLELQLVTTETFLDQNLIVGSGALLPISAATTVIPADATTGQVAVFGLPPTLDPSALSAISITIGTPFFECITGYYVTSPPVSPSPLTGILSQGDIITAVACKPVGLCGENFWSFFYGTSPRDQIVLTVRLAAEQYAQDHCISVRLSDVPPLLGARESVGPAVITPLGSTAITA